MRIERDRLGRVLSNAAEKSDDVAPKLLGKIPFGSGWCPGLQVGGGSKRGVRTAQLRLWAKDGVPPNAAPKLVVPPGFAVPLGISTRHGGVSTGAFKGLNLGLSTNDDPTNIEENRRRFAAAFGATPDQIAGSSLVHGDRIAEARAGGWEVEADGLISNDPNLLLVVGAADCFPLLFHSPETHAVGTAHCGWRGTLLGLGGKVVGALADRFGADPSNVHVAIGPGMQGTCYEVGPEVVEQFQAAGFPEDIFQRETDGRVRVDLARANRFKLEAAGVKPENIHDVGRCTHCEPDEFYSHRRDNGETGRMWGGIRAQPKNAVTDLPRALQQELVDVTTVAPKVVVDLPYARTDNFTGVVLYPDDRCLLRPAVAEMVRDAQAWIDEHHDGLRLVVKDGYRPKHVQEKMWAVVEGTAMEDYVANPHRGAGSVHSYGAAVDVTLMASDGAELDMGTAFDHLGPEASPRNERQMLADGVLTAAQVENRRILRRAMAAVGFLPISSEWWHFDAARGEMLTYQQAPA